LTILRTAAVFCLTLPLHLLTLHAQSRMILEANPSDLTQLAARYNLTIDREVENRPIYRANVSGTSSSSVLAALSADPQVVAVEFDQDAGVAERHPASLASASASTMSATALDRTVVPYYGTPARAVYVQQPAATLIRLSEAQQMALTGTTVVAIIDTGVDPAHPVLSGSLVPGYDFTRDAALVSELIDLDPLSAAALTQSTVAFLDTYAAKVNQSTVAFLDQSTIAFLDSQDLPAGFGHGTMIAGIVHLVAPTARIMPLKAFRADGTAKLSDIVRAVYYAVDHGATVINMSFSIDTPSPELAKALDFAASRNVICIASAGNMGKSVKLYPAGNRHVIGVGSTNAADVRSSFSNYDVSSAVTSAPGEVVITTFPGNHYAGASGTSFSSALVTGAVALLRQARPSASFSGIQDALDHGMKIEQKMGDARLDLVRSVRYLTQQ
jgi:subtilisin family serine protease